MIAGALAQKPKIAGHTWALLQYLLGFRRLGWKTLFVDYLEPSICVDEVGRSCALEDSIHLCYVRDVVRAFGLEDDYVLIGPGGESLDRHAPVSAPRASEHSSALLLNIMGYLRDEEILGRASKRIFLDIDPGFGQFWDDLGLHCPFAGYDSFVTIGLNIGRPDCMIPTCGLDWIVTPQPVVLEWWPRSDVTGESFTTIASWRGAYGPVEFQGKSYGLRVHQFRQFVDLPGLTGRPFELALAIDPAETRDLALLSDNGWTLVDPWIGRRRCARLSKLHRTLACRVLRRERYLRPDSRRLDQRSEPLLPCERQACTGTGDGVFATLPDGRGAHHVFDARGGRRGRGGDHSRSRCDMRVRPGPWRRSTSIPIKSWLGSCKSWAWRDSYS